MAFYSKNLISVEYNYQIYDKELLAIIRYLKHQRPKLEYIEILVKIFTNYKGLIYFAEGRDLSRRQARYLNILSEYNIKIVYRPGPQNIKADALTRIAGLKPSTLDDERIRQQYQTILTPDRLKLNSTEYALNVINNLIYYRIVNVNKDDEEYSNIRDAII